MLLLLELVQEDDVRPFLDRFDELDVDGSGKLDSADLERYSKLRRDAMPEKTRAQLELQENSVRKSSPSGARPSPLERVKTSALVRLRTDKDLTRVPSNDESTTSPTLVTAASPERRFGQGKYTTSEARRPEQEGNGIPEANQDDGPSRNHV